MAERSSRPYSTRTRRRRGRLPSRPRRLLRLLHPPQRIRDRLPSRPRMPLNLRLSPRPSTLSRWPPATTFGSLPDGTPPGRGPVPQRALTEAGHRPPTAPETAPYWLHLVAQNHSRLADPANPDLVYPGQ